MARYLVDDELDLEVEMLGLTAVPLNGPDGERATLARGPCIRRGQGRRGGAAEIGWSSRLVPE